MISNDKRIIKNASYLYLRMILLLVITLYTSRIVLNGLGVTDFGIYNVVGGVVAMFGFINGSIGTATSRFLTYELGKQSSPERMRLVFSTALLIHIGICLFVLLLFETIGLWYVYNVLVVPPERFIATLWVYQFSVVTALFAIISVPYNAALIAHERMGAFAFISIFEAIATLSVAFITAYTSYDKLIVYGFLLMLIQIILRIIYGVYCAKHFEETTGKWMFDKEKFKEMSKFALWIMNGVIGLMGYTEGFNLLLNFFFGPAVNAARGIAVQVQSKVFQFCNNFQTAMNPQITKSYAAGDLSYMHKLICNSSKYSMLLMFLVSCPLIFEADYILKLWLGVVPDYTVIFVQLTLVVGIVDSLRPSMNTAIHATGDIKKFQLLEGFGSLAILPIAYIVLKLGMSPTSVFVVQLIMFVVIQSFRIFVVCPAIQLSKKRYCFQVILEPLKVIVPVGTILYLFKKVIVMDNSFLEFVYVGLISTILTMILTYYGVLDKSMREKIIITIKSKLK